MIARGCSPCLVIALQHAVHAHHHHHFALAQAEAEGGVGALAARVLQCVVRRTARMVAEWQCLGFVHGMLNTVRPSAFFL